MKHVLKQMHGYGENEKMAEGDGGWFIVIRAPELAEPARACFHHPCTTPQKMIL